MFNFAVDHSPLRGLDSTFRDREPTHMSARKSAGFGLPSYLFLHRRSIRCVQTLRIEHKMSPLDASLFYVVCNGIQVPFMVVLSITTFVVFFCHIEIYRLTIYLCFIIVESLYIVLPCF